MCGRRKQQLPRRQYMLELENQLEAIAAPPLEPVVPGPAEEDVQDIQGESGVESGPESP
jgi:hypothetical protein